MLSIFLGPEFLITAKDHILGKRENDSDSSDDSSDSSS